MENKKKGQISTEYLIVIGFVTFVALVVLGISMFYSQGIQDSIKTRQIENFADKIISSSESVFYSGEPSKTTITGYIPIGVTEIEIINNELVFTFETRSGVNKISFPSNVPIEGTITSSSGVKRIQITAQTDKVMISQDE